MTMTTYIVRLTGADLSTIESALDCMEEHYGQEGKDIEADLESVSGALAARVPLEPATDDIQEEDGTV